jgi:beta-N-acetylhexosaminidase
MKKLKSRALFRVSLLTGSVLLVILSLNADPIDSLLNGLTLKQKVGQIVMINVLGKNLDRTSRDFLDELEPGGITLFGFNVDSARQVMSLCIEIKNYYHDKGRIQPFLAVDQEGGRVVRIRDRVTVPPGNMALGAGGSKHLAWFLGQSLAKDLSVLGMNMFLGPVLDVNSNPKNPVIGLRSFGEDYGLVSDLGQAFVLGIQRNQVCAVAKHFPGHGDTHGDTHNALQKVTYGRDRLLNLELRPFRAAIQSGLDAIMTAHIVLPGVDTSNLPATLSPVILNDILRDTLGFNGIAITDGLEMRAIRDRYGIEKAAVLAIKNGADIVSINWTYEHCKKVFYAVLEAVKTGEIPLSRVDESLRRVLAIKLKRRILDYTPLPDTTSQRYFDWWFGKDRRDRIIRDICDSAVTLVKNVDSCVPVDTGSRLVLMTSGEATLELARTLFPDIKLCNINKLNNEYLTDLKKQVEESDFIIFDLDKGARLLVLHEMKKTFSNKKFIVLCTGSPYNISKFPGVHAIVCTYSNHPVSVKSGLRCISGELVPHGRLPVTVLADFKAGFGLTY